MSWFKKLFAKYHFDNIAEQRMTDEFPPMFSKHCVLCDTTKADTSKCVDCYNFEKDMSLPNLNSNVVRHNASLEALRESARHLALRKSDHYSLLHNDFSERELMLKIEHAETIDSINKTNDLLLRKYMSLIIACEGLSYIDSINSYSSDIEFHEEEKEKLISIFKEIENNE